MPRNASRPHSSAPRPRANRSERLEARITLSQKRTFGAAAELLGESVSQFVLRAAEARAKHALVDDQLVKLTASDREAMIDALSNPPKPTKHLRNAFERYQTRFGG